MTVEYRIDVEDIAGVPILSFSDFLALDFDLVMSGKGNYHLTLSGFDEERLAQIDDDYLVRIWRKDEAAGLGWANVANGIHKTVLDTVYTNGRFMWESFGPMPEELLDKEEIAYPAGNILSEYKAAAATTTMYAYVQNNVGADALMSNGRYYDAVNPIVMGTDPALGAGWSGDRSGKNLLDVLQEIRDFAVDGGTDIDFRILYLGGYQFQFEAGVLGADRTNRGLNPATGLNQAGNAPILLGLPYKNVQMMSRTVSRYNEGNSVLALGGGQRNEQKYVYAQRIAAANVSPIAQRSTIINVSDQDSDALQPAAEAELESKKARRELRVQPRQGRGIAQLFWRDYFLGDFVTVEDHRTGEHIHMQVVKASVKVSRSASVVERINLDFRYV